MPRENPREKGWKKSLDQIRYEKAILSNLRGVGCGYLPKYYHTLQGEYKPFLLMDYIPGSTLGD
jgi:hypothetical protein